VADAPELTGGNSHIPCIFLKEGPLRIDAVVLIEELPPHRIESMRNAEKCFISRLAQGKYAASNNRGWINTGLDFVFWFFALEFF